MKEFDIKTFTALHKIIEKYDARTIIYRGVKSVKYPLTPKIGRIVPPSSIRSRAANEKEILRLFKEQALPHLDFMPANGWDWLAMGQHHGDAESRRFLSVFSPCFRVSVVQSRRR